MTPAIVWLRDDLRLADNPALTAAAERGEPVVLLYLLEEGDEAIRALGAASRWWLHHSLSALAESTNAHLVLKRGRAEQVIPALVAETGATAVHWNRRYSAAREIDARLKSQLRDSGVEAHSHHANLLFEPGTILTAEGTPYRVFTPFWRACSALPVREPLPVPAVTWGTAESDSLDEWALLPTRPDWAAGLRAEWTPGEVGARARLQTFLATGLPLYHRRDEPAIAATSRLSPHLRFGELSPFQIWHAASGGHANAAKFLSEVGWREFSWNILFHSPHLATENYRPAFNAFPWTEADPEELEAWRHGRTGVPLVDAGMRELWTTGYMHNRVRMVVASFLTKNLLIDWRVGEQWFWDTLVDADAANNPASWQWVAGSGADAAPYFRVFNPQLQAAKFDPQNEYVGRWVPEFDSADYPQPIVDLGESRRRALAAYDQVKAAQP
jgi:deoxyribodipyrimidine photo-lyase